MSPPGCMSLKRTTLTGTSARAKDGAMSPRKKSEKRKGGRSFIGGRRSLTGCGNRPGELCRSVWLAGGRALAERHCWLVVGGGLASAGRSCVCPRQFRHADQVVGGKGEGEGHADPSEPAEFGLPQAADRLQPAKDLLDALALFLAERVAGMASGAAVDRRAALGGRRLVSILCDVRGDAEFAQLHDEVVGVVALVGTERLVAGREGFSHGERRQPLGRARGAGQLGIDGEPMAVLHQDVADEAELAGLAVALAEQPGIVVGGRAVRFVRSLLTLEVALAVAALSRRFARTVLRSKALHAGPRLDQRTVDREVLVGQQALNARIVEDGAEELARDLPAQQPVTVLGEHRHVPHRIVDAETDEPAEQQTVVQLLHQLPLRADGLKRLQQQRPQQLLRRDRRPADRRINRLEIAVQPGERCINHRPDRPQRMGTPHPRLQIDIAEQAARPNLATAHRYLLPYQWYRITP